VFSFYIKLKLLRYKKIILPLIVLIHNNKKASMVVMEGWHWDEEGARTSHNELWVGQKTNTRKTDARECTPQFKEFSHMAWPPFATVSPQSLDWLGPLDISDAG
jgi:hypothetical protein